MKLTQLEMQLIKAIINSDFAENPLDWVWLPTPGECDFENKQTMSGVVSSLCKKGLARTEGDGNDISIAITQECIDLYNFMV